MAIEQERLISIIEFAQQAAHLRSTPAANIAQHRQFATYEHQLQGLPGVKINIGDAEDEDEIWMTVQRLYETKPPSINNDLLKPWVKSSNNPDVVPELFDSINPTEEAQFDGKLFHGTHHQPDKPTGDRQSLFEDNVIKLSEYEKCDLITAQFKLYIDNKWKPWAKEEQLRRKTIKIYSQLFTLKQQLEGSIVETQLELAWGVGLGIWNCDNTIVEYPLLTRSVELSLNLITSSIEIRPRGIDARLEVDWYASLDNAGVTALEIITKDYYSKSTKTFSPFDHGTYEPVLRSAATHLDPHGVYWPNEVSPENRLLPKPDTNLRVTDTWVLFARPRTNSLYLQDLERFKKIIESTDKSVILPEAIAEVVADPSNDNPSIELPIFRGVSISYHDGSPSSGLKDLYFPKPFNDEQTRIVQLLEVSNGVVVQGPPGTGKTHTIANVICHYLANGKRVLVTSMKEPALMVLHDQLPSEIQPLAISLLTNEQQGMKQFEHAINKIASEIQSIDRTTTARDILNIETMIDALHSKLIKIDREVSNWAKKNLDRITLDGEDIHPEDAAREITENHGNYEWLPDNLGISENYAPQFSDTDVVMLRDARLKLGNDIRYLNCSLPQVSEFPDIRTLLQTHQDLSRYTALSNDVDVQPLVDSTQEVLAAALVLLRKIEALKTLCNELEQYKKRWTIHIRNVLKDATKSDLFMLLNSLGDDLLACISERKKLLSQPVTAQRDMEIDDELMGAIKRKAMGKYPFGFKTIFASSEKKKQLDDIRIIGNIPSDTEEWNHIYNHLILLKRLRELATRWNALAAELGIETLKGTTSDDGIYASQLYSIYCKVKQLVQLEYVLTNDAIKLFPSWQNVRGVANNKETFKQLEDTLHHHLTMNRLANVWRVKERFQRVLEGRNGVIVDDIRIYLANTLGNPQIKDMEMQASWSALMAELVRVNSLGSILNTVGKVTLLIESSGANKYAQILQLPHDGAVDNLLPDNWRMAWRFKRLFTYLESIDVRDEYKRLSFERISVEADLAKAYQNVVVKRTWLKLAEKATPNIKSALQAYLTAIQKIGKGTGKRAVRYRLDARHAATQANPAIPCWIMPHYRVSESLPTELGCFDLVIIDEASQSDLTALPALLRAKKVLVVGDDKQVSPEGVGLEEEKVRSLMNRFLTNQVKTYRAQMSPERSIYDLFKVVFARSAVMLKEHFRSVSPIIEYSKREFYNHELRPLRLPRASERLDPPLIDVVIEDGYRNRDINQLEIEYIVDEITKIVNDDNMRQRSIGVVSLLGDKQSFALWERLNEQMSLEIIERHRIACGDARTFQGKERDIMFLSMVSAPNDIGAPLSRDTFAQRFNVAASRARDRMYLVRSVELSDLSPADKLRRSLISHFASPYANDEARVENLRHLCESPFEREFYDELTQRGYWVTPQVKVGEYRIDMVVEGHNDARLAIECDGDRYHGPDKWADDMQRQRVLERAGWTFWRCFASAFIRRRRELLEELSGTLSERGIEPVGNDRAFISIHTQQRRIKSVTHELKL